jgi:hypothetical protein
MAEMTTLVAAVYRKYSTAVKVGHEHAAPGVTSRFEVFHDDTFDRVSVSDLQSISAAIASNFDLLGT